MALHREEQSDGGEGSLRSGQIAEARASSEKSFEPGGGFEFRHALNFLMIWLYRLLFPVVMLVAAPYYLLRMRRRGGYRADFGQRFGRVPPLPPKKTGARRIWLQAVSVGELLAVGPLLDAWARDASIEVYLTTTTSTGRALAEERYAGKVLAIGYFPLDAWPCSARAWRGIGADLAILTEGERWPEHVRQAGKRGVPIVAINARLSDRSFRRMRPWRRAVQSLLGTMAPIFAASDEDAARFVELGFASSAIMVTGNIKLDLSIERLDPAALARLRAELGVGEDPVLLGASTWPGEERALIAAYRAIRASAQPCRLVLVPRHAERRDELVPLLNESGLAWHQRSLGPAPRTVEVVLADTTGELRSLLQLASLVFVGKTLPPHTEGQTPVEAAALGRPILIGPGTGNFRKIVKSLLLHGAACQVADEAALVDESARLFADAARRSKMGESGRAWHRVNTGAVTRTLDGITELLEKKDRRDLGRLAE